MRRKLAVSLMLLALLAGSCIVGTIEGSGNLTTETRQVSGFDRVSLSNIGLVVLTQGETEGLTVRADDNLMSHIVTEVREGTLHIGLTPRASAAVLKPTAPIVFKVSFRDLSGLAVSGSGSFEVGRLETSVLDMSVSGSGDIGVSGLTAGEVRTSISGSGEVGIDGEASAQTVSVSGSGRYRAQDLVTSSGKVSLSGSGFVVLHASDTLDVKITGSGTVRYFGEPHVTESITGSGTLESIGPRGPQF
ncbi:MAG: DUF2807 domain-containing protein [Candidatus Eisenbacteria sp.]|nr:DUF2807 domain-containing protein [Candidatus Eisenbacteria bacterium]